MFRSVKVHGTLFLVNLIYAGNYTIAKEVMPEFIKPFGFILLRVSVALILYWMLHTLIIKERVMKKDLFTLALCGVFGVAINQLLFFKGLNITSPINASIVMVTTPILVLLIASILIKEAITIMKLSGIAIGAAGAIMLIVLGKKLSVDPQAYLGNIYIMINATSYAIYLVLVKPLMDKYHPLTVIKWVFFFGFFIVTFFGYEEFMSIDWGTFTTNAWISMVYVVIGTTFLAYLLNIYALGKVNPTIVGIYIYSQPAMATIIAVSLQKDHLDLIKIISCLLIFTGVFLVSRKPVIKPANY